MPISDLHARVATIALDATAEHGFALGGGNALLAHGIITRRTEDVDLFTNREHGVEAAADGVEAALREAGFRADRIDKTAGLADILEGMGEGLAEWAVTAPGGEKMTLQMAYFDRGREPVTMEIGPVLDLEDVAGGKVCAVTSRTYERDYVDVAAMLEHYTPDQLISFAHRLDPGLTGQDFADTAERLDRLSERRFADYGLTPQDVSALRERFTSWPRDPEQIDRQLHDRDAAEQNHSEPEQEGVPEADAGPVREDGPGQDPPGPDTDAEAEPQTATPMRDLAAKLEHGEEAAQRLQEHRAERAAADDQQREHDQAAGQQHHEERAAEPEQGGPEIEP
jgi:nucleotidyltransferase AbiEii toxin of type IV toxin-antitoxin system